MDRHSLERRVTRLEANAPQAVEPLQINITWRVVEPGPDGPEPTGQILRWSGVAGCDRLVPVPIEPM
jgi:hypothetical protein